MKPVFAPALLALVLAAASLLPLVVHAQPAEYQYAPDDPRVPKGPLTRHLPTQAAWRVQDYNITWNSKFAEKPLRETLMLEGFGAYYCGTAGVESLSGINNNYRTPCIGTGDGPGPLAKPAGFRNAQSKSEFSTQGFDAALLARTSETEPVSIRVHLGGIAAAQSKQVFTTLFYYAEKRFVDGGCHSRHRPQMTGLTWQKVSDDTDYDLVVVFVCR